jgi:tetratricopeptide (TPR) repeat protein
MTENKPLVSLDEAYWWLNNSTAPYLRPPLHELLERFSEAEKANDRQACERICQQFIDREFNYLRSPVKELVGKLYDAVKIWLTKDIQIACKNLRESGGSYLRTPNFAYVLKMREAVSQDPAKAMAPLERLYSLNVSIADGLEAGETLVECGCALYKLENRTRALLLFQEANRRYNAYMHQIAVVYWMIGLVNWELGQQNKALVAWHRCVTRFEKLAAQRITQTSSDSKWYREALKKLNASIENAIEHETASQTPAASKKR